MLLTVTGCAETPLAFTACPEQDETPRFLVREARWIVLLLAAQVAPLPLAVPSMLFLMAWALRGPRAAVQALSAGTLVIFGNPALNGQADLLLVKWLLLLAAAVSVTIPLLANPRQHLRWLAPLVLYLGLTAVLALAVSYDRTLSVLKLITFATGVWAAMAGFHSLRQAPEYWLSWFYTLYCFVVFASLPLLLLPAGYHKDGVNFQGILVHPQTYGVYLAPMTGYLLVSVFTVRRRAIRNVAIGALGLFTISASGCRTAFLALALAAAATVLWTCVKRRSAPDRATGLLFDRVALAAFCGVLVAAWSGQAAVGVLVRVAVKNYTGAEQSTPRRILASLDATRGRQIRDSWRSFLENPWLGVGFGLAPPSVGQRVRRDAATGIPLSAPTEQGFLPIGVLAQVGVVGAAVLLALLVSVFRPVLRYGSLPLIALCLTAFFVNLGEFMFFAMGDLGVFIWLLFALSHYQSLESARAVAGACIFHSHAIARPA